jgi:hypothetical protein
MKSRTNSGHTTGESATKDDAERMDKQYSQRQESELSGHSSHE